MIRLWLPPAIVTLETKSDFILFLTDSNSTKTTSFVSFMHLNRTGLQ